MHLLLTTGLYVCAMISLRNILYHIYFRYFARRCSTSTHASVGSFSVISGMLSIVYVIAYWPVSLSFAWWPVTAVGLQMYTMPQLVGASCLLGSDMQALGDAASLLAGRRQAGYTQFVSVSIWLGCCGGCSGR